MPKFDVVVGNPPYQREMHIKFLKLSYDISNKYVIFVHPSSWLLDEKNLNKSLKIRNLVGEHIIDLTLINGNPLFNILLFTPLVITFLDKNYTNEGKILVYDKINNTTVSYDNIDQVNKWGNKDTYISIKNKILKYAKENSLQDHKIGVWMKKEQKKGFYINLAYIRGNPVSTSEKMVGNDFYTFIPKEEKVEKKQTKPISFYFPEEKYARNFLNYLKTDFARFSLSILKLNQHFNGGELKSVPWLDFSKEWTDKKLYKHFDLTQEEIHFIEKNIPDYYK